MTFRKIPFLCASLVAGLVVGEGYAADDTNLKNGVDAAIKPLMEKFAIPGMAVAVSIDGHEQVYDFGVVSKDTGQPVSASTLFELGSVSKTFTVTLASYAEVSGQLSLSDKTSKYLPELKGKPFGDVTLMNLGTHTAGGFPLQVPNDVTNDTELITYLKGWKPSYDAGTHRTYANPSIGMLGYITAKSMNEEFASLMDGKLFPALGLASTFIDIPEAKSSDYAQGYTKKDVPARLTPAVLSSEAYGVKSTAADMIRFVDANMGLVTLDPKLQQAISATHTGYFLVGPMTQDLIWEQYSYPADPDVLIRNNSNAMLATLPAIQLQPAQAPRDNVWINKTGSTNGFGAYVAFVPKERLGIVILANKNYPNEARVDAAYQILAGIKSAKYSNARLKEGL